MTDEDKKQAEEMAEKIATMIIRTQAAKMRDDEREATIDNLSHVADSITPVIKNSDHKKAWIFSCSLYKSPALSVLLRDEEFSAAFSRCQSILNAIISTGRRKHEDEKT